MDAVGAEDFLDWAEDEPEMDRPPSLALDERRLQVRAYNRWSALLRGRAYPAIEDLRGSDGGFGENGVVLDFSSGPANPAVTFIGRALRDELGAHLDPVTVADVPTRSLLSRLTDNYLRIIANRAPIGFEAEFTSRRGLNTLYRGVLMPCSSDDVTIDHIYGVINWKEMADTDTSEELVLEVAGALRTAGFAVAEDPLEPARRAPSRAQAAWHADDEFVVLLARRAGPGAVDILAGLPAERRMVESIARTL